MIYFENASEGEYINYQKWAKYLVEVCGNEIFPIGVDLNVYRRPVNSPLSKAVERAKRGESKICALTHGPYSSIVVYEIDDYDALMFAFGDAESDHRHHIVWEYSPKDDGKTSATIRMTFKCGCKLNCNTARVLHREIKEQHKIEMILKSIPDYNDTPVAEVDVRRCDIRDKAKELM